MNVFKAHIIKVICVMTVLFTVSAYGEWLQVSSDSSVPFSISTDFRIDAGGYGDFNVFINATEPIEPADAPYTGYSIGIHPAGSDNPFAFIRRHDNGTTSNLTTRVNTINAGETHNLRVDRLRDGTINVKLDGQPYLQATDTAYTNGGIYVRWWVAWYGNVIITKLNDNVVDITNAPVTVASDVSSYAVAGTSTYCVGGMWVSNAANGHVENFPAAMSWTAPAVNLVLGTNVISVCGTNANGQVAGDSVTLTRQAFDGTGDMVTIPAGTFTMGDSFSEGDSYERPTHNVYISAFQMDQYEVSYTLWTNVYQWATSHGYSFDNAGNRKAVTHPVQTVSWYDCVKWCNARSEKEGKTPCYYLDVAQTIMYKTGTSDVSNAAVKWSANGYRLPTEAEWEKAARGGLNGQRFPWIDLNITHTNANYFSSANFSYDTSTTRGNHPTFATGGQPYTSPAGYFAPNGYGLYDMAGNVYEWCWDWYDETWYINVGATQSDTRGPASGAHRLVRGGDWINHPRFCRVADRYVHDVPTYAYFNFGFRCVRGLATEDTNNYYSISGCVTGTIQAGVTIALVGATTASTTTDVDGNYSITNLATGLYTLTPTKNGYVFIPPRQHIRISGANVFNVSFNAMLPLLADFTASPISGAAPLTVTFTDTSSGNPDSWGWDFDGDGRIDSYMRNPTVTFGLNGTYTVHGSAGQTAISAGPTFNEAGTYFVTLAVKKTIGATATKQQPIKVTSPKDKTSIVLVHGLKPESTLSGGLIKIDPVDYWKDFIPLLISKGYKSANIHPISVSANGFNWSGQKLAQGVTNSIKLLGIPSDHQIVMVGHSMGGLTIRNALSYYASSIKCSKYITLATPHKGTDHYLNYIGPLSQLHPSYLCSWSFQYNFGRRTKQVSGWNENNKSKSWRAQWHFVVGTKDPWVLPNLESGLALTSPQSLLIARVSGDAYVDNNVQNTATRYKFRGANHSMLTESLNIANLVDAICMDQTFSDDGVIERYNSTKVSQNAVKSLAAKRLSCKDKKVPSDAGIAQQDYIAIINALMRSSDTNYFYLDCPCELVVSIVATNNPAPRLSYKDGSAVVLEAQGSNDNIWNYRAPVCQAGGYVLQLTNTTDITWVMVWADMGQRIELVTSPSVCSAGAVANLSFETNSIASGSARLTLQTARTNYYAGQIIISNGIASVLSIPTTADMLPSVSFNAEYDGMLTNGMHCTRWLNATVNIMQPTLTLSAGSISFSFTNNVVGSNLVCLIPVSASTAGLFSVSGTIISSSTNESVQADNLVSISSTGATSIALLFSDTALGALQEPPPYHLADVRLSDMNDIMYECDSTNGLLASVNDNPFQKGGVVYTPQMLLSTAVYSPTDDHIYVTADVRAPYEEAVLQFLVYDSDGLLKVAGTNYVAGDAIVAWTNSAAQLEEGLYYIGAHLTNNYGGLERLLTDPLVVHRPQVQITSATNWYNWAASRYQLQLAGISHDYLGIDYVTATINGTNRMLLTGTTNWSCGFGCYGESGDVVRVSITAKIANGDKVSTEYGMVLTDIPEPSLWLAAALMFAIHNRRATIRRGCAC